MAQLRRFYVDGRYGQIHVQAAPAQGDGKKRPLICLHQSPKSGREFARFMRRASADRTVIAPDYPGYGMSDPPPAEADATVEMYAHQMWRVVDRLGLGKVDLFGNHTGGKVAAEMAVQRPEGIGSIAMVSAAILTDEERASLRDMFNPIPLDQDGTRFTTMWHRIIEHRGPGMTPEMMAESMLMNQMGGEAYEWGHKAAFDYGAPFETALQSLPHRITILNLADMLEECTRRAAPLLNNGEIVECPDWGQGFLDAFPEEVAALVLAKLDAGT